MLLARGDAEEARAAAADSAAGFGAAGFPFDRGRALLVAGEALRRLGERRRAAHQIEAAKAIFADIGATSGSSAPSRSCGGRVRGRDAIAA